jgi:hypothetical protein
MRFFFQQEDGELIFRRVRKIAKKKSFSFFMLVRMEELGPFCTYFHEN